jgi:hypothetical protein
MPMPSTVTISHLRDGHVTGTLCAWQEKWVLTVWTQLVAEPESTAKSNLTPLSSFFTRFLIGGVTIGLEHGGGILVLSLSRGLLSIL